MAYKFVYVIFFEYLCRLKACKAETNDKKRMQN